MRPVFWLSFAALGCRPDPQVEAWHHAIRIDGYTRADGACDAPAIDGEPAEPWLFVAVSRGVPDSASLYWCEAPESCGAPFSSVLLRTLEEDRLAGDIGVADTENDLCLLRWEEIEATRDGDTVDLVFRTGSSTVLEDDPRICVDEAAAAIGGNCDAVLAIHGTQVE